MFLLRRSQSTPDKPGLMELVTVTSSLVVVLIIGYFFVNLRNNSLQASGYEFLTLHTIVDDWIPFVPEAVFFYYSYYIALFALPIIAFGSRERLHIVIFGLFVTSLISYSSWALLPVKMMRPDIAECMSFSCAWVRGMYLTDRPFCVLPSMHAGHSTFIMLLMWRYHRRRFLPVALWCMGIIASAVLIKQHYFVDLPPGVIVGAVGFWAGHEYGPRVFRSISQQMVRSQPRGR